MCIGGHCRLEREREVKVERERESIANDPGPWPNGLGTERIV